MIEKIKKYSSYIDFGIILIGYLTLLIVERVNKDELSDLTSFKVLMIFSLILILESLFSFNKNQKMICLVALALMIFFSYKFYSEVTEILNRVYDEEIRRKIAISDSRMNLSIFNFIYLLRLTLVNHLESKRKLKEEMNSKSIKE